MADDSDFYFQPPASKPRAEAAPKPIAPPSDNSDFFFHEPESERYTGLRRWADLGSTAVVEGMHELAGGAGDIIQGVLKPAGRAVGRAGRWLVGAPQLTEEQEANLPDPLQLDPISRAITSEAFKGYTGFKPLA